MAHTIAQAMRHNFLGNSPDWYKQTIIAFLVLNPVFLLVLGPFVTGWILIGDETTPQSVKRISSREDPDAAARPRLEITYRSR